MDERLKKATDPSRQDRAMEDRAVTENRALSDDDRVAMFRQKLFQSALPDLPDIPGYHVCWLTTTNPRDSIPMRMRLGYEPVKPADVPGYEISVDTATGYISVNEMVAFKIKNELYQMYMRISHHDEPMREEGKLTEQAEFLRNQARQHKANVTEEDGISDMRKVVRAPASF